MKEGTLLNHTASQLRRLYESNIFWLSSLAVSSSCVDEFVEGLRSILESQNVQVARQLLLMLDYEGRDIHELSTGEQLHVDSFLYLWKFLRGEEQKNIPTDIYLDFYHLFWKLEYPVSVLPDRKLLKQWMQRWQIGLDEEVMAVRARSKDRIIRCLIKKIERRHSTHSKYVFPVDISYENKYSMVKEWWNESRFHLAMAVKSPTELNWFLGDTLSDRTMALLMEARRKRMPFFVTPYYLSLLNIESEGFDDTAIRTYIMYSRELVETYGNIHAWEKEDVLEIGKPNAAGWLLPEGHNIHRRYPDVAILIPDSMGRACGGLCASCQRMYDFQSERLNFDFESLKPKESWDKKLKRLMRYFEEDAQLRDILITGGDALMSQNKTLRNILDAVYKMALRKKKANEERPNGEKFAELQRVRLGTRLLAYLPIRINDELVTILKEFKEKASEIGVKHFIIQTHFQSPLEVTPEAEIAVRRILSVGWAITNQLVYTVAASRRGHTAKLRQVLNSIGVIGYYTFSVKGFKENYAVFAPNSRSLQEAKEEKIFGIVPKEKEKELLTVVRKKEELPQSLMCFQEENNLLFVATDRNVLNLPAIGKSMTFKMIGITPDGRRILKFEHDRGRLHSPIIDRIGEVYIVENKSIAAYMAQLFLMGENIEEYASIWDYSEGVTEPRFKVYEYPPFEFGITDKMTNLRLEG